MRKIFTFLLSVVFVSTLFAQGNDKEARVGKALVAPIIGGELDAAWDQTDPFNIELTYMGATGMETPTLGEPGDTYFKALWDAAGIYLLVYVADDIYLPYAQRTNQSKTDSIHTFDNVEVFFDCNFIKEDGKGGTTGGNAGHYQFAPAHQNTTTVPDIDNATKRSYSGGTGGKIKYDYSINPIDYAPNYFYELFIPWSTLKDQNGLVDASSGFGFEIAVADNDIGGVWDRQRMVWSNNLNGDNDSWDNMDDAGMIYLDGYEMIYIDQIILTADDITSDNDTIQIGVELISTDPPNPPTDPSIKWVVDTLSTARYTLSDAGQLIPISNGFVRLYATSLDEIAVSNELTINIENQLVTVHEASYIVDGYNDKPQANGRPNAAWPTSDGYGSTPHTAWIEDGVFRFHSDSVLANGYSMKIRQNVSVTRIFPKRNTEFKAAWKMWSAEPTTFQLVLEQRSGWAHWNNTGHTYATPNMVMNGVRTRWDLTVTTEPTWFVVKFIPDNILSTQTPDFSFQPGKVGANSIYMDSLYLIEVADSSIIYWPHVVGVNQSKQLETLNVYPNPATDMLNVTLSKGNTNVAIYNSVGIKMEEIRVEGTQHVFNVSRYASGLYFVKANNAVVKFVK